MLFENILNKLKALFFVKKYYVFEFDLRTAITRFNLLETPKIDLKIDLTNVNNIEELTNLEQFDAKSFRIYFNRGDLCFCAKLNEKIIGYAWFSTKKASFHREFIVPENMVYAHNAYTVPEYRRLGVSIAVALYAFSYLLKKGYNLEYYCVSIDNVPNLKRNEKLGTNKLGILVVKKILGYISYTVNADMPENVTKIKRYFNIK